MPKYKCQENCGCEKNVRKGCRAPECCGKPMVEIKENGEKTKKCGCGCG